MPAVAAHSHGDPRSLLGIPDDDTLLIGDGCGAMTAGDGGHVLITSRQRGWDEVATPHRGSALRCANNLAHDLRALGEAGAARDLDQDTLERRRRVLGHDHPDTLSSAHNLALDLPALGQAVDGPQGR